MKSLLNKATTATILTPNRRLSAWLTQLYHQQKMDAGEQTWSSPDILPFNTWLTRLWDEYSYRTFEPLPLLLTPAQETYLWEMIVRQSDEQGELLRVSETADTAKSGYDLLNQWQLTTDHPLFSTTDDSISFAAWSSQFSSMCKNNNWLSNSMLLTTITELVEAGKIELSNEIILYGFTEIAPAMRNLRVNIYESNPSDMRAHHVEIESHEDEWVSAARWAKQLALAEPQAKIGIVIPDLELSRSRVKQLFGEVFEIPDQFNMTAGLPLAQYPVIKAALCMLDLYKMDIPQQVFSYLLATPFLGDSEKEYVRRANLDSRIRQDNMDTIRLKEIADTESHLFYLLDKSPRLLKRLQQWLTATVACSEKHTYSDWAEIFSQLLHALGWPGQRSLNTDEYQVVDKWFNLLAELSRLDQIAAPVGYHAALASLNKLIGKQSFQPMSPDANVQVMGILEAASLPFDHLWVTGLNDTSWPPQPHPNPFIPLRLQREFNMPHATSQRELEYCTNITAQFVHCTGSTIFSYAKTVDDLEVAASPLIKHFPLCDHLHMADYKPYNESQTGSIELEKWQDNTAPALSGDETVSGGVSVIKDQALCPFKSFATWRLHARELEEPLPGLRKKDRGTITHEILEAIWGILQNQQHLLSLSKLELETLVKQAVITALTQSRHTKQQRPEFLKLETSRLEKLMMAWLEHEKTRPPFAVFKQEANTPVTLGNLQLNSRIDRIDKLANGEHLVIDYKTSQALNVNNWFDERPEEPQLPIYALQDPNVTGIAFARLYTNKCGFDGISQRDIDIEGIKPIEKKRNAKPDWESQIIFWRDSLTNIANEFHAGDAHVSPKNGDETCQWCSLHPFCRIKGDESI